MAATTISGDYRHWLNGTPVSVYRKGSASLLDYSVWLNGQALTANVGATPGALGAFGFNALLVAP